MASASDDRLSLFGSSFTREPISRHVATVNINDNARVILGDVHYTLCPAHTITPFQRPGHNLQSPFQRSLIHRPRQGQITTKSYPRWTVQIPWLLTFTKNVLHVNSGSETESTTRIMFTVFGRYLLQIGLRITMGRQFSLSFHRPKLRNVVPWRSPFFNACYDGDVSQMRYLVANGLAGYDDFNELGDCAFYYAIIGESIEAVIELLTYGTDVDTAYGVEQRTVLSDALFYGYEPIVRILLHAGADQQHLYNFKCTPICSLRSDSGGSRCGSIIRALQGADEYAFTNSLTLVNTSRADLWGEIISADDSSETVAILLNSGLNPLLRDETRWNAFFWTCHHVKLECLRILVEHTAEFDIDMRDKRGCSLLHIAALDGNEEIVRHLLELGADWRARTRPKYHNFEDWPYYAHLSGCSLTPLDFARASYSFESLSETRDSDIEELEAEDDEESSAKGDSSITFDYEQHEDKCDQKSEFGYQGNENSEQREKTWVVDDGQLKYSEQEVHRVDEYNLQNELGNQGNENSEQNGTNWAAANGEARDSGQEPCSCNEHRECRMCRFLRIVKEVRGSLD